MMRRLLFVVGIGLVIVSLSMGMYPRVKDWLSPTSMPPQPVVASSHVSSDSPSPMVAPTTSPTTAAPVLPSSAAVPPVVQPAESATPAWLSIPSIGIDESIAPMGLNSQGVLEPPSGQTIWYNGSPKPGQVGVSLIAGHVQWGPTPDNFWRLSTVPDGSSFTIKYSDGTVTNWVTVSHKSELKEDVQRDQAVWGGSETPVVVLITCDKDLVRSPVVNHHHTNNWLVFARPAT